jgi:LuxR family maltose regulon positive regulatory protein
LGGLRVMQGQLHQAERIYREAMQWATERGGPGFQAVGNAMTGMGTLRREWNDLEEAADLTAQGIEHSQHWGNVDVLINGHVVLSRIWLVKGKLDGALDSLAQAEQLLQQHSVSPATSGEVSLHRVRLWLAQSDLASATRWLQERRSASREAPPFMREPEHVMQARVLVAQGQSEAALDLLAGSSQSAKDGGRFGRLIEILVLQALAQQMQSNASQASATLEQALTLAEPQGYVRIFVDEGEPMRLLISDFRLQIGKRVQIASDRAANELLKYANRLLTAFGQPPSVVERPKISDQQSTIGNLIEPLSDRELEVLRLLVAGQSYDEIAQALVISLNTVKTHVKNIYGKLEASNRKEAITKAKELGLA